MEKKKSFILHNSLLETLSFLTMEEKGILLTAILEYENGIPVNLKELPGTVAMAFNFIKQDLDRNNEKYEAACKAKSEAGKKSAQSKKEAKLNKETNKTIVDSKETQCTDSTSVDFVNDICTDSTSVESVDTAITNSTDNNSNNDIEDVNSNEILSLSYAKREKEQCLKVIDLYNLHCPSLKSADRSAHPTRVKKTSQVLLEFSEEELINLFNMAERNLFLTGHGPNSWIASFDWLMNSDHLIKLRENAYTCSTKGHNDFNSFSQNSYDFSTLEKQLLSN